jgi:glycosyltransferase involved in cell wall biosynthesis
MKVLWFTNTPSLGARHLGTSIISGGWIESLEAQITKTPNLELGVVFKWNEASLSPFISGKTMYYAIYNSSAKTKFKKLLHRWMHRIKNEENSKKYLNIIQEFKPDVVHIFGTEDDFGLIIPKLSVPYIIHIQGNLTVYKHKWFSGLTPFEVLKYSKKWTLMKGHGFMHEYFFFKKQSKREKKIFQNCHFFMGRTDWDKRITLSLSPDSKYFHCDEILREQFYLHQWTMNSSQEYTIFTTIRNNIYKGLETIFECKKILQKCLSQYNLKWKIAGIKNEDEITYLIERKYKSKFSSLDIHLLGSLQVNNLIEEMLKADLFIHPSHIDNSPNSICEAMVLGMPIIATYAGGIPSLIQDKKDGLLVQDGDPYALAGAIVELCNNRKYASDLGTNARSRALIRHNQGKIVKDVLEIYNSIIASSAKPLLTPLI